MADLTYYLRANRGQPVLDELFAISPWYVAEGVARNAVQAVRGHFKRGDFPDQIKVDRFVSTVKRKACNRTNIQPVGWVEPLRNPSQFGTPRWVSLPPLLGLASADAIAQPILQTVDFKARPARPA
jgi:hypothetical protein